MLISCGLPAVWANAPQWCILETDFGSGHNFVAVWQAWQDDPQRPRMLHVVAICVQKPEKLDAQALPAELRALLTSLQRGFNRLSFANGQVLLTLCVGDLNAMLGEQQFEADTVFISDPSGPAWDSYTARLLARCSRRGTRVSTFPPARQDTLRAAGFAVPAHLQGGITHAQFNPPWEFKRRAATRSNLHQPSTCVVIGAGLAGACTAASLARRDWQVQVLDAAPVPAGGASGLPAGLYAPYTSADNGTLSRLTNSGLRLTQQLAASLLADGVDWQASGVMERKPGQPEQWHEHAGWIKPARLVEACLSQPGVSWRGNCRVERLERQAAGWAVWGNSGQLLAQADVVVIAAAHASGPLLETTLTGRTLPLQALRGQVTYGHLQEADLPTLPPLPVNGHGSFIPSVPTADGAMWIAGASYARDNTSLEPNAADQTANFERLATLLPIVAQQLKSAFDANEVTNWVGIRCASPDRLPIVGQLDAGLWVCTALASRGLTLAPLCAELLAAQLHGEPLPLDRRQARALGLQRLKAL